MLKCKKRKKKDNMEQKKEEIKKETEKEQTIVVKKPTKALFKKKQKFKQLTLFEKTDLFSKSAVKTKVLIPKVKYRGPLSYRGIRIAGFVFLFLGILSGFLPIFAALNNDQHIDTLVAFSSVLEWTEQLALPLFLASAFSVILVRKETTITNLIKFLLFAIALYILTLFAFEHYIVKFMGVTHPGMTPQEVRAYANVKTIEYFGELIHYNIFLDMFLCVSFYYFLCYNPKNLQGRKLTLFRFGAILPVIYLTASMVLFGLSTEGIINIPVAVYALLVCRSPAVYLVFFLLTIFVKMREKIFAKKGGTQLQYQYYLKSNANSLHFSLFYSIILAVVSLVDFALSFIPKAQDYGFGNSYMMFLAIPFVMLLSYTRDYKNKSLDLLLPIAFMSAIAFVVLELIFEFVIA